MKSVLFRPTSAADYPALADFLKRIFNPPAAQNTFLHPDQMQWKYWDPHPAWNGSRSYVLERSGEIIAHAAAWPVNILSPAGAIPAMQVYDWAADPAHIGAGLSIFRHMARLTDVIYSIAGSDMTLRMRNAMGFRPRNLVRSFARTVRPVQEVLDRGVSWKLPVRVVRSALRSWPLPSVSDHWQAVRVPPQNIDGLSLPFAKAANLRFAFDQSTGRLAFLAHCPAARLRLYAVHRGGTVAGYFAFMDVRDTARLVDAWVDSTAENDWSELYRLAVRKSLDNTAATTIVTYAPLPEVQRALERVRFRCIYEEHVDVYDPKNRIPPDASLFLQLIDTDFAFL